MVGSLLLGSLDGAREEHTLTALQSLDMAGQRIGYGNLQQKHTGSKGRIFKNTLGEIYKHISVSEKMT